jgi:hypothetical protein
MAATKTDLMTAGNMAKELGVPDSHVKKAIKELGLEPDAKKGVCAYYSKAALTKIKAHLE